MFLSPTFVPKESSRLTGLGAGEPVNKSTIRWPSPKAGYEETDQHGSCRERVPEARVSPERDRRGRAVEHVVPVGLRSVRRDQPVESPCQGVFHHDGTSSRSLLSEACAALSVAPTGAWLWANGVPPSSSYARSSLGCSGGSLRYGVIGPSSTAALAA
jgi:hypothetical protein